MLSVVKQVGSQLKKMIFPSTSSGSNFPYIVIVVAFFVLYLSFSRSVSQALKHQLLMKSVTDHLVFYFMAITCYVVMVIYGRYDRQTGMTLFCAFFWALTMLLGNLYITSSMDPQLSKTVLITYTFTLFLTAIVNRQPITWSACMVSAGATYLIVQNLKLKTIECSYSDIPFVMLLMGFSAPLIVSFLLGFDKAMEQVERVRAEEGGNPPNPKT